MNPEQKVCTLEQAQKLKELGVKQKAGLTWTFNIVMERWELSTWSPEALELLVKSKRIDYKHGFFSAFDVAELGELMPDGSELGTRQIMSYRWHPNVGPLWCCHAENSDNAEEEPVYEFDAATEAEARAGLLIFLLEGGKANIETINQRL